MSKETDNKRNKTKRNNTSKRTNNKKNTTTNKNIETITKANKEKKNIKENKKVEKVSVNLEEELDEELYYDEDLEDFYNDDDEIEETVITKPKKNDKKIENKKKKKEERINDTNIKKIEKMAKKNNKVKKKNTTDKISKIGYFLDNNRNVILAFILGVIISIVIAFIIWPDRIATLKNGEQPIVKVAGKTYTADNLYKQMKDHYSVSQLLDKIDDDILSKKYPENEEMKKEVESTAENYINMYKQYYNYTEEQFLSANGFSSRDAYLEYLKLDNRRKKYEKEYIEKNLTDKEIESYYNENVYGDIKCEHVLVEVDSNNSSDSTSSKKSNKLKDEDAKKLAQEIIDKINDGTSWKDIQKDYKDKVTYENLGYQAWDSDLETSFKDALKKMDNKSYSNEPVKTSYGYHVIYRETQKKTPTLKKSKKKIIEKLIEKKIQDDSNILYKALINLRKEKKIKFNDTDMNKKYDAYITQYNK
ncbi:MAG: peptidylprolyl isomerase [Bacilli bacterium]|nr:peptidylprolyl isomerase [Bacilli bacterium]